MDARDEAAVDRSGYLWAEVGALGGALVAAIPAGAAWIAAIAPFMFEADGWYLVFVTGAALAIVILGSAFGCRFALRRKALPAADGTALVLGVLLVLLYAIGFWSSDTWLQSDLLPYLTGLAPLTPLLARRMGERSHALRDLRFLKKGPL